MSEHGMADHVAEAETERRAELVVTIFAEEIAKVARPIWRLGDGHGGCVMSLVADACTQAGLVRPDSEPSGGSMLAFLVGRDGWDCHYCGHPLGWGSPVVRRPEKDHMVPRSKGGSDESSNLVLACGPCNSAKGARLHDDFCRRCTE